MSETEIVHFGVKGMKWGVRKSESSVAKSKKVRTPEEEARRKKILKGIGITAGILAVAGISYLTYDQIQLSKLKGMVSIGETNFENIKKISIW